MSAYGPPRPGQPQGAGAYLQQQLEQASPTQQLILLLDGAIKFTLQAKDAVQRRDIQARHTANARSIAITTFLLGQQDPEKGGEAARTLGAILTRILQRQLRIDFENSVEICDEVAAHFRQLRAGFSSLQPQGNVVNAETPPTPTLAASA